MLTGRELGGPVHLLLGALLAALVSACGGGTGAAEPAEETAFRVTAVTPLDASEGVPLTEEINVVFSRPVDPASLGPDTLQVVVETGDVIPGLRLVPPLNRALVRFLPSVKYFPFAEHTIRVTPGVRDENGTPLDRTYEFRFRTEPDTPVLPVQQDLEDLGDALVLGRWWHRMTLLDGNRFLITGGYIQNGVTTATAENLVAPLRQSFLIPSSMRTPRAGHIQLRLVDGRVLIAGGESSDRPFVPLRDCEIFDPASFTFAPAAPMHRARSFAQATLLRDGRVLVTGGQGLDAQQGFIFRDDAEIYDPAADTWTLLESTMSRGLAGHGGGRLPGGDVVLIGGTTAGPAAERFTAATESFAPGFALPSFVHFQGAAAVLPGGRPFVAGGFGTLGVSLYDPGFGFLGALNKLPDERVFATATALPDGRVFIIGGTDFESVPALLHTTLDVFFPIGRTGKIFRAAELELPRPTSHHAAALGPAGAVWVTGGLPLDFSRPGLRQVFLIRPGDG